MRGACWYCRVFPLVEVSSAANSGAGLCRGAPLHGGPPSSASVTTFPKPPLAVEVESPDVAS